MISWVWIMFVLLSLTFGGLTGQMDAVSAAVAEGAKQAVSLLIGIAGLIGFWSGLMELVSESGLAEHIRNLLEPLLRLLYGKASRNREAMKAVSANMTANFLGLSNAATPSGLRAAELLYADEGNRGCPDAVLTLITLNTTSIQFIPSTVAAVRASYGAVRPFDIMPAVWGASLASVAAVLLMGRLLRLIFPNCAEGCS